MQPADVTVVTYPKSGTTWVAYILAQLYSLPIPNKLDDVVPRVPKRKPTDFLMKSHMKPSTIPGRKICIIRNPVDVFMSFYNQTMQSDAQLTPQAYMPVFLDGRTQFGKWLDHVNDAMACKAQGALVLSYEDLTADTPGEIAKIAAYLQLTLTPERIAEIAAATSFHAMKADAPKFAVSPFAKAPAKFFRSGAAKAYPPSFFTGMYAPLKPLYDAYLQMTKSV